MNFASQPLGVYQLRVSGPGRAEFGDLAVEQGVYQVTVPELGIKVTIPVGMAYRLAAGG